MAARLSAETIEQIRLLAAGGVARNQIARELGVSAATVTKHAPAGSFDRSATAVAVKARQIDMAAMRAQLAADLLSDAARLREQVWQPALVYNFGGKDNTYEEHQLDEQPTDAKRTLIQAATTAVTAHLRLVDHDSDGGLDEARSVLDGFMDAVARRAAELDD
jgi:hypothetical protein